MFFWKFLKYVEDVSCGNRLKESNRVKGKKHRNHHRDTRNHVLSTELARKNSHIYRMNA
jgi:hypothetical protein